MKGIFAGLTLLLLCPIVALGMDWKVDPDHSSANFTVKHMGIADVAGSISDVHGTITLYGEKQDPLKLELTIGLATIYTGVEKRDTHLKSPDFLEVAEYPTIVFQSKALPRQAQGKYKLIGDLTLHGVTQPVELELIGLNKEVVDPWDNIRRGAKIVGSFDRRDFGIIYNAELEGGDLLIDNEVAIEVDLEFIQQ